MANAAGEIYKATSAAGCDAVLVSANGDSTIKGLRHWKIPGLGFLAFTPAIVRLLADKSAKRFDAVHLHYPCYGNALMVSIARLLGARQPLVISYHMDTVGKGARRFAFWLHRKIFGVRLLRAASAIVVASRDYAEHSRLARHPELMAKIVEIPFGVDCERFRPQAPKSAEKENCAARKILFVAALDKQHYFKGLDVLLKALAEVREAVLTVVGGGDMLDHYKNIAKRLGLSERVTFAGRVSDEELPNYYRRADVYCAPSIDASEAYGISIVEALSSGVPAIATSIPGVRSVIADGETGFLVPPNDVSALSEALRDLLGDPETIFKMGLAARSFALNRTWEEAGKKYSEIYKSLA